MSMMMGDENMAMAMVPVEGGGRFVGPLWRPLHRSWVGSWVELAGLILDRKAVVRSFDLSPECEAVRDRERVERVAGRRREALDILCLEAIRRERAVLLRERHTARRMMVDDCRTALAQLPDAVCACGEHR